MIKPLFLFFIIHRYFILMASEFYKAHVFAKKKSCFISCFKSYNWSWFCFEI